MRKLKWGELPGWFALEKYAACRDLDAKGWAQQLSIRFHAKRLIDTGTKREFDELFSLVQELGLPNWPFTVTNSSSKLRQYEGTPVADCVYPMRLIDLVWLGKSMEQVGAVNDDPCDVVLAKRDPYGLRNFAHILVDLSATDEQLERDFLIWLKQQRTFLGPAGEKRQFTSVDFRRWIADRLLPFIDLKLWALSERKKVTHSLMGEVLAEREDERDVEQRDRRTVEKKAEWLLSWPVIMALHAQGNKESRSRQTD